ncbi:MAG: DUF116 domain-containing protein [Nitrospirae bacterium]|nr:DUF116 domain-containing protein [Nitrospirota bacterium]
MTHAREETPFRGKTYSLFLDELGSARYYELIRQLTDRFLDRCPDEKRLLAQVRNAAARRSFIRKLPGRDADKHLVSFIRQTLRESLSVYTTGVRQHLKGLPLSQRFDAILRTKEEQYHLYMIEIELANRIYREAFRRSSYKFALIAHCLRDFRPDCKAGPGEYETVCRGCSRDCLVHLGSILLKKYDIHPYISVTMDLEKLFRRIKAEHKSVGALGIACVPELAMGMRMCIEMDISPVGIPLDANRCARWMKKAHETSFNLEELEKLIL